MYYIYLRINVFYLLDLFMSKTDIDRQKFNAREINEID